MTRVYVIDMGRKFYYLQWDDPVTGRRITRSSKCKTRRDAERKAQSLENQLSSDGGVSGRMSWTDFAARYQMEHLRSLALRSQLKACSVLDSYERVMQPKTLVGVNAATLSTYAAHLRANHRSEATIAAHLRTLRAALSWAHQKRFIATVPEPPKIRRLPGSKVAKGRPITDSEFCLMLWAVPWVTSSSRAWGRLLIGLWLSGLRIGEAMNLRWKPGRFPSVDLSGSGWLLIPAAFDKGHADRRIPLTPDFAAWLRRNRNDNELVLSPGVSENRATKVISMIGRAAGIITDPATGRTATAHDLRRAFAQRWAARLTPIDLQRLMRHASIDTTRAYYTDEDADGLATRLVNILLNTSEQ